MREAVDDLMLTLNEAASEVGLVSGMVDLIADAMGKVETTTQILLRIINVIFCLSTMFFVLQLGEGTLPEPEGAFVEYQTTMVKYSKAIAVSAQEMVSITPFFTLYTVLDIL